MLFLAIGSNLNSSFGNRFQNIELAITSLEKKNIIIEKRSSFYETPSYPNNEKPKFINIVLAASTNLKLDKIIEILIDIEVKLERKRNKKNEPRTCDIDIIDYNGKIIDYNYKNSFFTIPHEKLAFRNFVLIPLMEIKPNWTHPKSKEKIKDLVSKLSDDDIKSILKVKKN